MERRRRVKILIMPDHRIIIAIKALIVKNNTFVVLTKKIGDHVFWDLPGGRMEYGESPLETLTREVKEELNIAVEVKALVGSWWFYRQSDQDQTVCFTYRCIPLSTEIDMNTNPTGEPNTSWQWITKKEFLAKSELMPDESLAKMIKAVELG